MNQASVKQVALESFRLGQRIAEMRHNDNSDEYQRGRQDGYHTGWEDGAESVRCEWERVAEEEVQAAPPVVDLGGLGYSEWWSVYAAVLADLGGPAPLDTTALLDEADDLMGLADSLTDEPQPPKRRFNVDDWRFLLEQGIDPDDR